MYTVIIGAGSQIALEYIKLSEQKEYILIDLPSRKQEVKSMYDSLCSGREFVFRDLDIRNIQEMNETFESLSNYAFNGAVLLAGINTLTDALDVDEAIWDSILDTNLKGCFFAMCEVAKNMIAHDTSGSIVNISSQHGYVGNHRRAAYCASKAALLNLNRTLALEWAKYGIRVNSVSPTWILNDSNSDFLMDRFAKRNYLNNIPLNRYCEPRDIAYALEYLMCEKSSMITGQSIIIDGGWTIK